MTDKDFFYNKISQAFVNIGKDIPDDERICLYKTGALDSYEVIHLILEIELLLNVSKDLDTFADGDLSLSRIFERLSDVKKNGDT